MRYPREPMQEWRICYKGMLARMLAHPLNRGRPTIKKYIHLANTHREKYTPESGQQKKNTQKPPAPHIQNKLFFRDQNLQLAFQNSNFR